MANLRLKIIGLLTLVILHQAAPTTYARIIFADDVFENDSEVYEIGSDDDAAATTLTLEFGGTNAESLTWNTSIFTLSDDLTVQGNLIATDITANGILDANGAVTLGDGGDDIAIDSDDWDITSAGVLNGFTGGDATTEDTMEAFIFDADAENITGTWEIQDNVSLVFGNDADISVQYDETTDDRLEITGANGVLVEKTGAGISLQVNDVASDTTPFVVNGSGEVGIGTSTPDRPLHIVRSGDDFGLNYPGAHYESTGTTGFGPSLNLDATSYTGGTEFYIASTGASDATGTGNFLIYDFTDTASRFMIDTDGQIGINGVTNPASPFDVGGTGELVELGDGTGSDFIINFDDGTDRNFGWDDSEGALSTFDQELRFRTRQSATPPVACSSTVAGMQWMDTDTGIVYVCDTSNSRNKWLSLMEISFTGGETGTCGSGSNPATTEGCIMDIHNGVDANDLGYQLPRNATIVGGSFHGDASCTNGSGVMLELVTGDNGGLTSVADLFTSGCTDANGCSETGLNVDIAADTVFRNWLDNDCSSGSVTDWSSMTIMRWRHD